MRQFIGSTSHTTILPVPTTKTAAQESCLDDINKSNNEVRPRLSSSLLNSRMTDMTTPIGMATPIAPDLVWPSHPDICRATTRPPRPSSTAECLRLIARLRGEQASAASWEPRPPFEAAEMD